MDTSVDYQAKATSLQNDINNHLILLRQTVMELLQANMNQTLEQTRNNSDRILSVFGSMTNKMDNLVHDDCYEDLVDLADGIVKITGFRVGNILTEHDKNITTALGDADETIKKFDIISTEVQRIVHKAHIKSNVFKNPELVSKKYIAAYEDFKAQWDVTRPQIVVIVLELRSNFNKLLSNLGANFEAMHIAFDTSFELFESDAIAVCEDYSKTAKRSFSKAGKFRFFDPAEFLPEF